MIIPAEYLRSCLEVDNFGVLWWVDRPVGHFVDRRAWHYWCYRCSGRRVSYFVRRGYLSFVLSVAGKRRKLLVHRVIWAFIHGEWPEHEIDHIDGDRANNHHSNLRIASRGEQNQNAAFRPGKSGVVGVIWHARKGCWRARVKIGGKRFYRDAATIEEASAKRDALKAEHHLFHPRRVERVKRDILRV